MSLDDLAKEIYWASYDRYIDSTYRHPLGFTKDVAWAKTSEIQRDFCRRQAERAHRFMKAST